MRSVILTGAALAVLLAGAAAAAEPAKPFAPLGPRLQARYEAARANPALLAQDRATSLKDSAAVDRVLAASPISPLDYLEIDRQVRHYDIFVPRFLGELHIRWVKLHEKEARELYGDAEVDRLLDGWPVDTGREIVADTLAAVTVSTNRNVAATDVPPPNEYDGEIQIAINPRNSKQLVAAANTWGTAGTACDNKDTQAVFFSSNGGNTWDYTCAPSNNVFQLGTCTGVIGGSDPALAWNDNNEVFLNYMLMCRHMFSSQFAMVVARSANGGATWVPQGVIKNSWATTDLEDKNFYAVDTHPTSPFYGRHYTCWDRNNNEKMAFSTNNGATWTEVDLPGLGGGFDLQCDLAVQRNGTVHIIFDTLDCLGGACGNEYQSYTRSTDGGVTWSPPTLLRDFNLVNFSGGNKPPAADQRGITPFGAIDVDNSGGACDGTLYVTYSDFETGGVANTDIWLIRSFDQGVTWSPPVKVNDDGLTGRTQFHPFLKVSADYNGEVLVVAWHDTRNDPANTRVETFLAQSNNCGASFLPNVKVAAPSAEFNNSGISFTNVNTVANPNRNPNQFGEYLGLDVKGNVAYVAWVDSRHFFPGSSTNAQKENLGFASVQLPFTRIFYSNASEDGWILEASETSNTGGFVQANEVGGMGLRLGDDGLDRQYRSVLSFDTSPIPDGLTVTGVQLRIKRGNVVGSNPFKSLFQNLRAVVSNAFSGSISLEATDFQLGPDPAFSSVCNLTLVQIAGEEWATCNFSAVGNGLINKTGRTQVKLAFQRDDNDDQGDDFVGFFASDDLNPPNWPVLWVDYQ